LLHDDLLATGGTAGAALELLKKFKISKVMINFIVELSFLKGRDSISDEYQIYSMIKF
jgi:adenine phosphoribosyltransferase